MARRVMTRGQALAQGFSPKAIRWAVERGRWQRPFRGVFVTHSGTITWHERLEAAVLAAGSEAAASRECALALWGLSTTKPSFLTIDVPESRIVRTRLPGVRVRRRSRNTRTTRKGIPVTGLHQTVLDVLALPRWSIDDVVSLLAKACAPGRSSPATLREELAHHPGHPRRELLTELLETAELGLGSGAEWRYVTDVERAHGLPAMTPQVHLDPGPSSRDGASTHPGAGRVDPLDVRGRRRRMDFFDEERALGLEIDGELYHRDTFRRDRARDRESAGRGRLILRACFVDVVATPCELAADVAVVQINRGWRGRPTPCSPTCALATDPRLSTAA